MLPYQMSEFIPRLVELLVKFVHFFVPFYVLRQDYCGIVMRLGRYHRTLHPGINFVLPLHVDRVLEELHAVDSSVLPDSQSLTTSDLKSVCLRMVVKYHVVNPFTYILETASHESVINEMACALSVTVARYTAEQVLRQDANFTDDLLDAVADRVQEEWGVEIVDVGLVDCVNATVVRLIQGAAWGASE